jgi:hypothetical protein
MLLTQHQGDAVSAEYREGNDGGIGQNDLGEGVTRAITAAGQMNGQECQRQDQQARSGSGDGVPA